MLITLQELCQQIEYCSTSGLFKWLVKRPGKPAFATPHGDGYLCGTVNGQQLLAHRVAWAIYYGNWPDKDIDHRDGDKSNNRISNLREVTEVINGQNKAAPKKKSTLPVGVSFDARLKKNPYRAYVMVNRKQISLGQYATSEEASQIYQNKIRELGFSTRHGK